MAETIALSVVQRTRYEGLKIRVRDGLQSVFAAGEALKEIRDSGLYREEYKTFNAFCKSEYKIARAHAYRLISASEVRKSLGVSPMGDILKTERQARALSVVPEENRLKVLQDASRNSEATPERIKQVASKNGEGHPTIELDKLGHAIPKEVVPDWIRAEEVGKRIWSMFGEIKALLGDLDIPPAKREPAFRELLNVTMSELESLRYSCKQIIPHAVCDTCQGRGRKQCTRCYQRGFLSKFLLEACPSEKQK